MWAATTATIAHMRGVVVGIFASLLLVVGSVAPVAAEGTIDDVRVTRTEARKIVLTWTPDNDVEAYDILRDGGVVGTSDDNWFVASGLTPQTDYSFVIRSNTGAESAPLVATTAAVTPPATSIDIWWIGPKGVTLAFGFGEFEVRRDGVVIADRNGRVLRDVGLTPNTTYTYEIFPIGAAGNLGPASTQVITTRPLLSAVQGVEATLLEPGIVSVTWEPLDEPSITRYRFYVNGELQSGTARGDATSARVPVPAGVTSTVQVAAYNGGGGPLSAPVTIESGPTDPRQIGLRVHASWPGTVVLNWRNRTKWEKVFFNGEEVGLGKDGWITISDLPYNAEYDVVVRSFVNGAASESIDYPITTRTVQLFDVRNFTATATSATSIKLNWRKSAFVNFEVLRDGEPLAIVTQADVVPFFDTDVTPGTTYTYTIRQIAEGAIGESTPVSVTVTTPIAS